MIVFMRLHGFKYLPYTLIGPLVFLPSQVSFAQTGNHSLPSLNATTSQIALTDVPSLTAPQFDAWVEKEATRLKNRIRELKAADQQPGKIEFSRVNGMEGALLQRLKADKYVSDDAVLNLVSLWTIYEQPKPLTKLRAEDGEGYLNTQKFINSVLALLYKRPYLQAVLQEQKAQNLRRNGNNKESAVEYKKSLSSFNELKYSLDLRRQGMLLQAGSSEFWAGNKEGADALFWEAYSYPWYKASGTYLQYFRAEYVSAASALINLRRGNRKALQQIHLDGAVIDELGPKLKQNLDEVGG